MPSNIPEELTRFIAYDTGTINLPMWKIEHDRKSGEILFCKNSPFNKWVGLSIAIPSIACIIIAVLVNLFSTIFPQGVLPQVLEREIPFFTTCVTIATIVAVPFFCVVAPFVNWIVINYNSAYWGGPTRFRYNIETREIYFPRERVSYKPTDYLKLVFGYTTGYDTRNAWQPLYGGMSMPGAHEANLKQAQFYIIILKNDGQWVRYTLATDMSLTTIKQAIVIMKNYMIFEVITRKMSVKEGVGVQAISSDPKTPNSGANSEEKSEASNIDTNESIDKSNQKD